MTKRKGIQFLSSCSRFSQRSTLGRPLGFFVENVSVRAIAERWNEMKCRRDAGLIPHDQPGGPLVANLAAFWQQISPIVPVLPTVPAHKSCAVYNLGFEAFHGMEVVVGKIELQADRIPE
jgi:hypothetical protein